MKSFMKKGIAILSCIVLFSTSFVNYVYAAQKVDISIPVELTWYVVGLGEQQDTEKVEHKVNEYLKSKYKMNTKIKLKCIYYRNYGETMQSIISERQPFDICFTSTWINNYYEQVEREAFIPLDTLWNSYAPKTKALLEQANIPTPNVEGISYAMPAYRRSSEQWGFVLRKDLVKKYNIDVSQIKTLKDIEPFLKKVKKDNPKSFPLTVGASNYVGFKDAQYDQIEDRRGSVFYPGVIATNSKDMKVINQFEMAETYSYFNAVHKFYKLGYISEPNDTFKPKGRFAELLRISPDTAQVQADYMGNEWITIPLGPAVLRNTASTASMQAISSTSKNPERAMMFLEILNTDTYLNNLINFGIEGVHYKKVSKNLIKETEQTYRYYHGAGWMYGNEYLNYIWEDEGLQDREKYKQVDAKAKRAKAFGFVFNSKLVEDEVKRCEDIWFTYIPKLESGELNPDIALKEMIQLFNEAGVDKIIAEKQSQLDAWLAQ